MHDGLIAGPIEWHYEFHHKKFDSARHSQEGLDYHLLRALMVIICLFFGYQKWFNYEVQALIPSVMASSSSGCTFSSVFAEQLTFLASRNGYSAHCCSLDSGIKGWDSRALGLCWCFCVFAAAGCHKSVARQSDISLTQHIGEEVLRLHAPPRRSPLRQEGRDDWSFAALTLSSPA